MWLTRFSLNFHLEQLPIHTDRDHDMLVLTLTLPLFTLFKKLKSVNSEKARRKGGFHT